MRFRRFSDPVEFAAAGEPPLIEREAENNLPLGLIDALVHRRYDPADALMALVEQDAGPCLVVLRTPPHNLVLSTGDAAAVPTVVAALHDAGTPLPGVVGPDALATSFAAAWCARTGERPNLSKALMIHALDRLVAPPAPGGHARWAHGGDGPCVMDWFQAFCAEAIDEEPPPPESILARIDERRVLLWCDPRPVSLACLARTTPHGRAIGPVYTPPEHRRRGYAAAVTAELCQRLQEDGVRCVFLFTDRANATAAGLYGRIGFQPLAPWSHWRFDPAET